MILVATGYYVPFTRLFEAADRLAEKLEEEVIVQGHSGSFRFRFAKHFDEIEDLRGSMIAASVVVTQGAMSMVEALEMNRPLVVAPRQQKFQEHINDHQVEFAGWLRQIYGFPVVMDMEDLEDGIAWARKTAPKAFDASGRKRLEDFLGAALSRMG